MATPPTSPKSSSTTAANRQQEVAALALSAERVANAMIARIPDGRKPPTIVVAFDEYVEIGIHMARLSGVAKELHGLLAGGAPTRDEVFHLSGNLSAAGNAVMMAMDAMQGIVDRLNAPPKVDGDIIGDVVA